MPAVQALLVVALKMNVDHTPADIPPIVEGLRTAIAGALCYVRHVPDGELILEQHLTSIPPLRDESPDPVGHQADLSRREESLALREEQRLLIYGPLMG